MKDFSSSKQMTINMIGAVVSFMVTMGINFFLTPHLVSIFGKDAYGFIGLANNFVQYATIVTTALNSMAGRFISIEYHKGNIDKASRYFSSVLVADIIIAGVMLLVAATLTLTIDMFLDIPNELIPSVKITFGLTFLTFVISIITAIFTTATFVKNKLYINSIRDIISNLLKVVLIVALFTLFETDPKLYFLAMATMACSIFLLITNISVKKRILSDVKMSLRLFDFKLVKVIISSGIWNSVSTLCNVLNTGLDLLICNMAINSDMMGLLGIAKTIPHAIDTLITTISNIFTPRFTILYAKNKKGQLIEESKYSSSIVSFIMTTPLAIFIAFGKEFYTLWQPKCTKEDIIIIQILSILACLSFLFTCHTRTLNALFLVCNKVRASVIVSLINGIINVIVVLLLVNFTSLGVYAIAGVSSILMILKAIIFVPLYTAHILDIKPTTFYRTIFRGWIGFAVLITILMVIEHFVTVTSWIPFIAVCAGMAVLGYIITFPILFTAKNRKQFFDTIKKKIKKS